MAVRERRVLTRNLATALTGATPTELPAPKLGASPAPESAQVVLLRLIRLPLPLREREHPTETVS